MIFPLVKDGIFSEIDIPHTSETHYVTPETVFVRRTLAYSIAPNQIAVVDVYVEDGFLKNDEKALSSWLHSRAPWVWTYGHRVVN